MGKRCADDEKASFLLSVSTSKTESLQLQDRCEGDPTECVNVVASLSASNVAALACHIHCHHVLTKILGLRGPAAAMATKLLATLEPSLRLRVAQHVYGCRVMIAALKNCDVCTWSRVVRDSILESASALRRRGYGGYVLNRAIWEAEGSETLRAAAPELCSLVGHLTSKPRRPDVELLVVMLESDVEGAEEAVLSNPTVRAALGTEKWTDPLLQLLLLSDERVAQPVRQMCAARTRWAAAVDKPFVHFPVRSSPRSRAHQDEADYESCGASSPTTESEGCSAPRSARACASPGSETDSEASGSATAREAPSIAAGHNSSFASHGPGTRYEALLDALKEAFGGEGGCPALWTLCVRMATGAVPSEKVLLEVFGVTWRREGDAEDDGVGSFVRRFCFLASLHGCRRALRPLEKVFGKEVKGVDVVMHQLMQAEKQSWQSWLWEEEA